MKQHCFEIAPKPLQSLSGTASKSLQNRFEITSKSLRNHSEITPESLQSIVKFCHFFIVHIKVVNDLAGSQ